MKSLKIIQMLINQQFVLNQSLNWFVPVVLFFSVIIKYILYKLCKVFGIFAYCEMFF